MDSSRNVDAKNVLISLKGFFKKYAYLFLEKEFFAELEFSAGFSFSPQIFKC